MAAHLVCVFKGVNVSLSLIVLWCRPPHALLEGAETRHAGGSALPLIACQASGARHRVSGISCHVLEDFEQSATMFGKL